MSKLSLEELYAIHNKVANENEFKNISNDKLYGKLKEIDKDNKIVDESWTTYEQSNSFIEVFNKNQTLILICALVEVISVIIGLITESMIAFGIGIAAFLVIVWLFWFHYDSIKKIKEIKAKILQALKDAHSSLTKVDEDAIKFYNECQQLIESGENENEVLLLIGQKYSIKSLDEAKSYFDKGLAESNRNIIINKYFNSVEKNEEELKEISEIDNERVYKGVDKYLVTIKQWLKYVKTEKDVSASLSTVSSGNMSYRAVTSDSAIAGGVGSAIGGLGVGVASALTTEAKNQAARQEANRRHELSVIQSQMSLDMSMSAYSQESKVLEFSKLMDSVVVDSANPEEKFKLLNFENVKINLTAGDNLKVTFDYNRLPTPMVLSKPTILDGSLKIDVLDKNNNVISTGYYSAPGYNEFNYKNAGFAEKGVCEVICPINEDVNLEELKCEITPSFMWLIQENEYIFAVNNEKLIEAFEEYEREFNRNARKVIANL